MSLIGSAAVLLALTLSLALVHHVHSARKTLLDQIALDRCVGRIALDLRGLAEQIERSNGTLKTLRRALLLGSLWPPAAAKLRAAIQAVYALQQGLIAAWWARLTAWTVKPCLRASIQVPRASPPWWRPPPDLLGPSPLERKTDEPSFTAMRRRLRSASKIQWKSGGWRARWTPGLHLP